MGLGWVSQSFSNIVFESLTLLIFCNTSFILSGWTADRTKMRVTTSTLPSGTFSLRSSLVKSHWKAQQCSGQYRGFFCITGSRHPSDNPSDYQQLSCWKILNLHQHNCHSVPLQIIKISNLDKFNSPWREVTGINKKVEVILQQREDAVSNTTASLQQHQPLGFKLQTRQAEDNAQQGLANNHQNLELESVQYPLK